MLLFGASFVGIVAGHTLVRAILGGGGQTESPHYDNAPQPPVPCQSESHQLGKCIELANTDISKCQVYMDLLVSCQRSQNYR